MTEVPTQNTARSKKRPSCRRGAIKNGVLVYGSRISRSDREQ